MQAGLALLLLVEIFALVFLVVRSVSRNLRKQSVLQHLERQVVRGTRDLDQGARRTLAAWRQSLFQERRRKLARQPLIQQLQQALDRAGSRLLPEEFLTIGAVLTLVSAGVLIWRLGAPAGLGALAVLPLMLLALRIAAGRRRAAFERDLPDLLTTVASGLRAGLSLLQSLENAVKDGSGVAEEEMARVVWENRVGMLLEDSLSALAQRIQSREFQIVVTAILINREVGGNLAEIFDRVADTVRERMRIRGDLDAMTAQGRLSALVISLLPPGIVMALLLSSPHTMAPKLFTGPGPYILGLAAGLELLGIAALRMIIRVEV